MHLYDFFTLFYSSSRAAVTPPHEASFWM
uniref:Uncharacterized protein n=1 Tax=Anguilla anguilla TaxID=7936 RepID=A0A0E9Q7U0_ANGAN